MTTTDRLLELARTRLAACEVEAQGDISEAAARLLADLYKAGITPKDWAAVAALPQSCLDACRQRQHRVELLPPGNRHQQSLPVIHNFGRDQGIGLGRP